MLDIKVLVEIEYRDHLNTKVHDIHAKNYLPSLLNQPTDHATNQTGIPELRRVDYAIILFEVGPTLSDQEKEIVCSSLCELDHPKAGFVHLSALLST